MDRRDTIALFRQRLGELIGRSGLSQSAFAARAGLDRSTLSLLLSAADHRMPRADSLVQIAAAHHSSVDWLLGLSESPALAPDIVASPLVSPNADDPADEQLRRWHGEARGQKVRYVPSTIPDHLKTEALIAYENGRRVAAGPTTGEVVRERIAHASSGLSEIEVCSSRQSLETMARGEGIWRQLPLRERRRQLEQIAERISDFYPNYRWFLFDGRTTHASPYTVFGSRRAAIYMGSMHLVFTASEVIRELTLHFEDLVRSAIIQPTDVAATARHLLNEIS